MTNGTQANADEWVLVDEATKLCGLSRRELLRKVEQGKIRKQLLPTSEKDKRIRSVFSVQDIAKFREDRKNGALLPMRNPPNYNAASNAIVENIDRQIAASTGLTISLMDHLQEVKKTADPKPWLTLREAAEYSGLPVHFLRKRCKDRSLGINVAGPGRPVWMIKRTDLTEGAV